MAEQQRTFLGVRSSEARENREKILGIIAVRGVTSRKHILEKSHSLGLKKRRVPGLLKELERRGLIARTFPRTYRLNFSY